MDTSIVATIDRMLEDIRAGEQIAMLLAIESGSRAWGFPSPDSDYDCRFIYLRRPRDYLSLFAFRDVIESPRDPVLDIGGWDLAKTLKLLIKGNAVVIEWLTSPIHYRGDAGFRARMLTLSGEIAPRDLIAQHYLGLARRQLAERQDESAQWRLKKLFYALRPAIALRWLRLRPGEAVAPMHFPTLCEGSDLAEEFRGDIDRLLNAKAATREFGRGPAPRRLIALIESEMNLAREWIDGDVRPTDASRARADDFFCDELARQYGMSQGHRP